MTRSRMAELRSDFAYCLAVSPTIETPRTLTRTMAFEPIHDCNGEIIALDLPEHKVRIRMEPFHEMNYKAGDWGHERYIMLGGREEIRYRAARAKTRECH